MQYKITDYTKKQADKLGLEVKPSTKKYKKIDVYKDNKLLGSVGDTRYQDYGLLLQNTNNKKSYADFRRRLYKIRHSNDSKNKYSNGWLASNLLW